MTKYVFYMLMALAVFGICASLWQAYQAYQTYEAVRLNRNGR